MVSEERPFAWTVYILLLSNSTAFSFVPLSTVGEDSVENMIPIVTLPISGVGLAKPDREALMHVMLDASPVIVGSFG